MPKKKNPATRRPPRSTAPSIMDVCGVGRKYDPRTPVTVEEMNPGRLDEDEDLPRGRD